MILSTDTAISPLRKIARVGVASASIVALAATGLIAASGAEAASDSFTSTGAMATTRQGATAALTSHGTVLVAGGYNGSANLATTSVYQPDSGTFTTGPTMSTARNGAVSASLNNGLVLIAGGYNGSEVGTAQLYDPSNNTLSAAGAIGDGRGRCGGGQTQRRPSAGHGRARRGQRAGLLAVLQPDWWAWRVIYSDQCDGPRSHEHDGDNPWRTETCSLPVGSNFSGSSTFASAEIFNATNNTYAPTGSMAAPRFAATATLLPNGKVLIAGGSNGSGTLNGTELYDPYDASFRSGPSMAAARKYATSTLLSDGRVLIAGGVDSGAYLSSTEIYNPATNSFSAGPTMTAARGQMTATRIASGQVLIPGGIGTGSAYLSSADLFTPAPVTPVAVPQSLVNCSALPRKIKRTGTTVVLKRRCLTSSGQSLSVSIKRVGKVKKTAKVTRKADGKVSVRTRNSRGLKLRVTRSAPASAGFQAYAQVKVYKIK
ncbi:MAG: kelch repeat-containing protein [Candidatus Nanopelagicales bacterium]